MNDWVQRKPLRLRGYDYGKPGYYFVTVCTAVRGETILAEISPEPQTVGAAALGGPSPIFAGPGLNAPANWTITLTDIGKVVRQHIENINTTYGERAGIDCYVIMPDHVHIVVWIHTLGNRPPRAAAPTVTLSGIVNALKGLSSKKAGYRLWQRSYYDHIIRSQEDLEATRQYILDNPQKWRLSRE